MTQPQTPAEPGIYISSLVSGRTREPLVDVTFVNSRGEKSAGQLTMGQCMAHTLNMLSAMNAAQTDAFLLAFLTDPAELGMPIEKAMNVLVAFRRWRAAHEDLPDGMRDHVVQPPEPEPPTTDAGLCARCRHTQGWHRGHGGCCTAGGCLCDCYVPIEVQP